MANDSGEIEMEKGAPTKQRAPKYHSTVRKSHDPTASMREGGGGSLLRAARSGNVEKLTTLLDQESIDISTSNSSGLTALHLAAKEGHCSIINELLQRGAPINQTTKRGNTALHIASLAGKLAVVELLLAKGADANSQAQNAFTPLYMAAQEGHEVIVEYLLNHGANQSISTEDGFTPLAVALQENKDKVVQLLLDNDVKGRVKLPALHIAARKDDVKAAVLLLQSDNTADTTSRMMVNRTTESGFTALHIAAHYGNVNVATLLLNRGASVDFKARNGITPMHVAAKRGNTRFCALLLDRNGRPDACTRDGLIPIHCAARSGHLPIVKLFLDCENTPKYAKTKNGLTPLHMAAQGGHADVIEILLDKEYPVDDITSDYLSALHIASHCGHVSVAELMLSHNANVDCKALNGFTPLHVACKKNRIKIVELLISYKANIEAVTESGLTPLHIACFMGHDEIVELLITRKAKLNTVNVRGETALHMATRSGKTEIVTFLLRHGAKPDTRKQESQTCLHLAARLNKHEILKLLIKNGATVDATMEDGYTPLHVAAKEGHVDICETLLDKKASVAMTTKKGFTPLHLAAKYGRLEVANLLIRNDAEPDAGGKNGLTPLHVAAHFDNQQVALLLLKNGASPHASGKNGYTPLHIAAKKNQMEIAITLLEYGASPNSKTRMDVTPLHLAAQEGHTDMCSLLLAKDANVNAAAKHGLSPMHLAAQEDRVSVAKVLYDNKSLVDPLTKSGCTPLHVASHHGNINVANYLLSLDAKVNAKTKNGYTPLHQASQQGHTHVVNLLIKYGASPNELTNSGNTALSLAKRLGYISVVDTLKTITTETTTTVTEEKRKYNIPETVNEGFMSDASDDEGDETMVGGGFLTNNEMKELGDDSIVPTEAALFAVNQDSKYATLEASGFTGRKMSWSSSATNESDNIKSPRSPRCNGFLVSFMVDARGGTVRGTRHYDLRIVVPPQACRAPTRVTCRFARRRHAAALNPPSNPSLYDAEGNATRVLEIGPRGNTFLDQLHSPPKFPPLTEGEGLAARVIQLGPKACRFLGPVAIEVPHFANVKNNYRQVVVMRSNDGINWKDHKWPCTDEQFCKQHGNEELQPADKLAERRIFRIIASDFPRYFALVSRPLENAKSIGEAGGELTSSVVKEARAKFPEGSLTKTINVAMQVIPITPEICKRAVGNKAKASAILTIEPRRRKFHKSIILTVPLPEGTDKKDYLSSVEDSTLRLLCSISGEDKPAQWEDITGSTNFNFLDNFVTFTSTVSARFWLIDCRQPSESSALAHQIYAEATRVPYMAKFLVYAKSHDPLEGRLRVFCLTEDRYEKTLEKQENYVEIARSKDVEVTEGSRICVECSGNLSAPIKSGQVHKFQFQAFNDNRIQLLAKVRDSIQEPCGRLTFTRLPLGPPKSHGPRKTLCNLNVRLPPCDRESDSDEDYSMPDEKSVSQTPEEEASEARKRYFLVDPASVDASARDESSPEEIAKDMVDVIQKLNQVQVILQPQADAREDKKEEFDEEDADVGVEETAQVVTEVRNRLVEMKQLLESEEIRSDSYLEFESPKVEEKPTSVMGEHLDRTSRIFERNVEPPAAPERSSLSELHGRDFRGSATVKEISDNFDVLAQRIDADMHGSASEHDDFSVKFEEKVETAEGTVTVASTDVTPCLESTHSASPESLTQSSDTFIDHNQENEGDLIDFLNYDLNTASSQTPAKESATSDLTSTVAETIVVDERTHTSIEQTIRDINSNEELCQLLADDLTSQNDVTQPNDVTLNNEHVQGSSQRFDDSQLEDKAHSDVTSINDVTTFTDVTAVPSVQVRGESPLVEDRVLPVVHQVESVYNEEQRCFAGLGVFQMRRSQSATSDQMKMVRFHEDVTVINADRTRVVRSISKEHVSSSSEDESEMSDTESASFSPKNSDSEDSAILDEEEEEKPKTLQQRISAYQAASDELHRELERFRRNTPRYGDQRAALPNNRRHSDPHTTTESASTSTAALTSVVSSPAVNNVDDGSESEDEISPVILEESHTVKELLKTWEQKPVMKPVTFRRTPSTEEHKVFSKTPETSDGSQVLSRFPEVEIEIAQPSTISELSESDSCQLSLDEGLGDWNREIVMISESAQKEQCVEEQQSDDDKDVKSPVSDVETDGKSVDSLLSDLESLQSKQYEASIKDETSCNKYSVVQTTVQTNDLEKTEDIGIANISFTRRELVQHTEEVTKSELEIIKAEHHRAENPSLEPEQNKDEEVVFNDQASDQQTASIEGSFDATDIQEPETGHPESLIKMEQSSDLQAYQPLGTNEVTSTTDLTQYKEVDDDLLLTETHVPQSSQFTSIVQEHLTEYESSQQVQDDQTIKVEVVHDKERLSDLQPRTNFQTTEVDEGQLLVDAEETLSSTQEPVSTVETISYSKDTMSPSESGQLNQNVCKDDTNLDKVDTTIVTTDLPIETVSVKMEETSQHEDERDHINVDHTVAIAEEYCDDMTVQTKIETHLNDSSTCITTAAEDHVATNDDKVESCLAESNVTQTPAVGIADELSFSREYVKTVDDLPVAEIDFNTTFDETARTQEKRDNIQDTEERTTDPVIYLTETKVDKEESLLDQTAPLDTERYAVGGSKLLSTDADEIAEVSFTNEAVAKTAEDIPCLAEPSQSTDHQRATVCAAAEISHVDDVLPESVPQETEVDFDSVSNETVQSQDEGVDFEGKEKQTIDPEIYLTETKVDKLESSPVQTKTNIYTCLDETARSQDERGDIECAEEKTTDLEMSTTIALDKQRSIQYQINDTSIETDFCKMEDVRNEQTDISWSEDLSHLDIHQETDIDETVGSEKKFDESEKLLKESHPLAENTIVLEEQVEVLESSSIVDTRAKQETTEAFDITEGSVDVEFSQTDVNQSDMTSAVQQKNLVSDEEPFLKDSTDTKRANESEQMSVSDPDTVKNDTTILILKEEQQTATTVVSNQAKSSSDFSTTTSDKVIAQSTIDDESVCSVSQYSLSDDVTSYPTPDVMVIVSSCTEDRLDEISRGEYQAYEQPEPEAVIGGKKEVCQEIEKCEDDDQEVHETEKDIVIDEHVYQQENIKEMIGEDYGQIQGPAVLPSDKKHREEGETTRYKDNVATSSQDTDETGTNDKELDGFDEIAMKSVANQQQSNEVNETESAHQVEEQSTILREGVYGQHHVDAITDFTADEQEIDDVSLTFVQSGVVSHRDVDFDSPVQETEETTRGKNFGVEKAVTDESDEKTVTTSASSMPVVTQDTHVEETAVADANTENVDLDHQPQDGGSKTEADITVQETVVTPELQPTLESQCAEMKKEDYQPEVSVTSTEVHDSYTAVDSTSHVQEASCSDYESKSATTDQMQDDRDGVEINAYSHEEFATSEPFNEVKEIRLSFETVTDLVQQGILEDLSANDNSSLPEVSHFELDRNITTADQLTEGTGDAEDVFGHIKSAASEQKVVEETKREENGSPGDQQYSHQSDVKIPEEVTEDVNSLKETSCSDAQVQEHVSENEGLHISTDNDQISLEQSDVTIVKEVHEVSTYESDLSPEKTTLQEEKIDDLSNELMDTRTENKEDLVTYEVEETCAAHEPEHKTSYLLQTTITDTGLDIIQTGSEDATVGYAVHSVTQLTLDEEQLLSDENRVDLVAVKVERPDEEHEINQATSYHFKEFENADVLAFDQQIPEHKYIEVKSQDISNEDDQTDSSEVGHPIMPAHQAEEGSLVSMETDHVKHQDDIIVDDVTGSYVDDVTRTFVHSDVARHSEVEFDSPVHQSDEVICATKIVDVETVTDGTREDGFATDDHEPEIEGLTQFEEALMPDTEVDHVTANYHFQDELCDVGADMAGQKVATVEPTPLTYQDHDTVDNFDEVTNTQTDDRLRDGDLESLVQSTAVEQISCSGTRIKDDIKFSDTINPLKESSPSDNERVLLSNKIVEHPKDHDDHVMRTTDENECESETEADAVPFNTEEEESFQSEKWEDHVSTEREETYFAEKTTTQEEFVHKEPSAPVYNVDQSSQVTVDGRNEEFESVIEVDGKAETLLTAETSRSDLEGFVTEISHQPRQICRSTQEAFLSDYSSAELSNQTSAQQLQESNIIKETRSECLQQEQTTPEPRDSDSVYHHELFYTDNGEKLEIESNKGMSEKVATELPEQSHIDDVLERDVDTDTHCAKRRESVKHGLASLRQTQISFDSIAHQQTVDNSLKRLSSVSSSSCLESEEGDVDLRRDSQMDDIEEHPLLLTDEESQEDIHDEGHTEELEQTSALSKSEESYMQRIGDDLKLSDSKADECGFGKSETHETHTKDSIEQDKFLETAAHDLVTAQISLSQLSSAEQFSEQELFASTEAPFALTDEFIVKTPNNSPEDKKDGDEDLNNKNSTQECLFEAHNIDNPALRGFETSNLMDLTAKESEQLLHKEAETEDHLWKTDGEKRLGSEDHDDPERFSSMQVNYSIQDEDQVIGTAGTPDSLAKELADAMYEEIVELEKRDLPEYDDVTGDDVKHHDDVNPSYRLAHDDYTTQHGIDLFSEIEASLGNCQTSHFARDEGLKADEASGSGSFDDFATDDVVRRSSDVIAKQGEDLLSEIEASLGAKATPCVDQNERESAKADDDVKNNAGFQEPSFCATEQSIFSEIEATLDDNKRANIAEVDIGNAGVAGETNAAGSSFNQRNEIDPFDTGELSHGNVDVTEGEFTSALIEAEMEADAIQRSMLSPSVGNMHSTSNRSSCDDFASTQGGIISFSISHSSEFKSHENHKTIQEDLKLADTVQNDVIDASPLFESELYHVSDPSNLLTPEISVTSHGDPVMILKTDDVGCADIKQAEMMQLDDEDADHVTLDSSDEDSDKDSECSSEMGDERGFESLQCSRIVISESTEPLVLSDAVMSHVEDDVAIETVPTTAGSSLGVAAMSSSVSTQEFSSLAEERALKLHDVTSSQYEKEHVIFDTEEQFDARATCRDSNRLLRMMSVPGTQIKTVEEVYTLSDTEVDTDDHLKLNATTTKGYSDIIQERPTSPLPPREPLGSHQERRASEEQFSTLDVAHSSLRLSVEQDLSSVHVDSIGDTSAGDEFSYRNYHGGIRSFDSAATSQQFSSAEFFSSEEVYASMKGQSDAETFVQTNVVNDQEQQRDQDTDSSTLFTVKTERTYMEATTSSSKSPTANYMSMASPLATINAPGFQLREEEFLTSLPLEDVLILESHKKSDAVLEKDVIDKGSAGAKSDELMTFAEKFSRFKESIEAGGSYSAQEILVEDNHQPPGQDSDAREQQRDYIEIMDTKQARAEAMRLEDLSYMAVAYDAAAKKPLYGEEQSYSPSSNSSATCSEHTSESSDCIEMDSVDAARYRFVEEQYTDDQPLLRPETLSCDENEHLLCQEEIQSDDEDFQKSHASGNRFQRQIHSTPKTSRIPVAKTSSSFVPEKKTKPAVRKSGIPTTKRTSTGSSSRLSQSLPTKGRQQKKMKQEKTRKESDKESSSIIRSTSASKLPVRRNLSITKPTVVAKQLKSEGLVSPGSTSSTVSRSSSGSSFSSFRFRKSGGSSPTQEGSIFRNEPFKSRTVSNDKYIALRQGVFTYKMSPAEEKEKRKKKREATTVGSSTDSSPLTASEEHGKMTNIPRPSRLQHPSSAPYACEETTEKQKPDSDHFLADSLGLGGAEIVREAPGAPCLVSNITYSVQGPPTNVQSTLSEVSHSTERRIHSECSAESYAQFAQTLAEVQMVERSVETVTVTHTHMTEKTQSTDDVITDDVHRDDVSDSSTMLSPGLTISSCRSVIREVEEEADIISITPDSIASPTPEDSLERMTEEREGAGFGFSDSLDDSTSRSGQHQPFPPEEDQSVTSYLPCSASSEQQLRDVTLASKSSRNVLDQKHQAVASQLGIQWPALAGALGLSPDDVWRVQKESDGSKPGEQSMNMLSMWIAKRGDENAENIDEYLSDALRKIGRDDLCPILDDPVFHYGDIDPSMHMDKDAHDSSAFRALSDELGSPFTAKGHVSSPFPFTSASKLTMQTSTPTPALKARNETLTDGDASLLVPPPSAVESELDDVDKPHFNYVIDDDEVDAAAPQVDKTSSHDSSSDSSDSDREETQATKDTEEKVEPVVQVNVDHESAQNESVNVETPQESKVKTDEESREDSEQPEPRDEDWEVLNVEPQDAEYEPEVPVTSNEVERAPSSASSTSSEDEQKEVAQKTDESKAIDVTPGSEDKPAVESDSSSSSSDDEAQSKDSSEEREITKDEDDKKKKEQVEEPKVNGDNHVDEENKPEVDYDNYDYSELEAEYGVTTTTTIVRTIVVETQEPKDFKLPPPKIEMDGEGGHVIEVSRQVKQSVVQQSASSTSSDSD